MRDTLTVLLYVLGIGMGLAINWLIWFKLVPMSFRALRDQPGWSKLWRRKSN